MKYEQRSPAFGNLTITPDAQRYLKNKINNWKQSSKGYKSTNISNLDELEKKFIGKTDVTIDIEYITSKPKSKTMPPAQVPKLYYTVNGKDKTYLDTTTNMAQKETFSVTLYTQLNSLSKRIKL
jgi:hypothetical protein